MVWIYLALGVALVGLILLGWYVFRLYRKVAALLSELGVLADRAAEALELVGRIEIPDRLGGRFDASFPLDPDGLDDDSRSADVGSEYGFSARLDMGAGSAWRT